MAIRNVVTLSHLDPELHQWAKEEARRRAQTLGLLIEEALREFREKDEAREVGAGGGTAPSLN